MLVISKRGKFASKAFARKYTRLREAPDRAMHLKMDVTVKSECFQVVLFLVQIGKRDKGIRMYSK